MQIDKHPLSSRYRMLSPLHNAQSFCFHNLKKGKKKRMNEKWKNMKMTEK